MRVDYFSRHRLLKLCQAKVTEHISVLTGAIQHVRWLDVSVDKADNVHRPQGSLQLSCQLIHLVTAVGDFLALLHKELHTVVEAHDVETFRQNAWTDRQHVHESPDSVFRQNFVELISVPADRPVDTVFLFV